MNEKVGAGLFRDIIGHKAVVRFLEASLDYQTVSHAYLFIGPRGAGKTAVLTRFLSGLIGGARADLDAFLTYPDFTLVRRGTDEKTGKLKKNITVEQIREMRSRLAMGSFLNSWKIAVIDGAENLSEEAANALLKTLEEPTRKTVIVLLASAVAGIPETVASRCQVVRFRLVAEAITSRGLETLGVKRVEAERWAAASDGRPGLAIRLATDLEERAAYESAVKEGVRILTAPLYERFAVIEKCLGEKSGQLEAAAILKDKLSVWESLVRAGLLISMDVSNRVFSPAEVEPWARRRSPAQIVGVLRLIEEVRRSLSLNVNPRLAVERLVIDL